MVLIERHLINVAEDAPVYEVADKAGESGDSVTFDLVESHEDVLHSDLLGCIVKRLAEVLRISAWSALVACDLRLRGTSVDTSQC